MQIPENYFDLISKTLLSFHKSIKNEDFNDFIKNYCSENVRDQFSSEKFLEIFKMFIEKKIDIRSLKYYIPALIDVPKIIEGRLCLNGFYFFESNSVPNMFSFNLEFLPEGKDWKLSSINVSTEKIPLLPSNAVLINLLEDTLLDLNEAVKRDDFSYFTATYFKKTSIFDSSTSPVRMREVFANFIEKQIDLKDIEFAFPIFEFIPKMENGVLKVKGYYKISNHYPSKINFDLSYFLENLRWRLEAISLNVE